MSADVAGYSPPPQDRHQSLSALLDAIESAVAGNCCASATEELQRLRAELLHHIDGESWLGGDAGSRSCLLHLYESGALIRRRLFEMSEALRLGDPVVAAGCVADLREMIATHLKLEREAAAAVTAGMPA